MHIEPGIVEGPKIMVSVIVRGYLMWWRRRPASAAALPGQPGRRVRRDRDTCPAVQRNEVPTVTPTDVDRLLASIHADVLQDVWLSRARRAVASAIACGLGPIAGLAAVHAHRNSHWLAFVANMLLVALAVVTLLAVRRARFKWCCAAASLGGIGTVAGVGAFWWYHTAAPGAHLLPAALCTAAAAALTAHWLGAILTPLERSHPDMRVGSLRPATARRPS